MRIPEVQKRLRELAVRHSDPELADLAGHLSRRRRRRAAAPPDSKPMTPVLRAQIQAFALANPLMTQAAIASRFNVNPGRVSEALIGVRT